MIHMKCQDLFSLKIKKMEYYLLKVLFNILRINTEDEMVCGKNSTD